MPVQCIQTAGQEACPEGHYALYEHANYNTPSPGKTSPTKGQTVIANESVSSLNGYHSHAGLTTSVVNKTKMNLELFINGDFGGKSMTVAPGQRIDQLPKEFDNAVSSARLNAVTAGKSGNLISGAVGTVTKTAAGIRDTAYTALGGHNGSGLRYQFVQASGMDKVEAKAPEGLIVTGGGFWIPDIHNATHAWVTGNYPSSDGKGWTVEVYTNPGYPRPSITAYAICVADDN
ncbi:peptidase inhibitor family I36 protein [Streptomyces sp. NPDC052101]|uniref:peptidase inhibitor family I36 protein n=1 Tax=Streptomyces sp. NPDC052101 TaxID=3155763 RepID=UPI00341F8C3E